MKELERFYLNSIVSVESKVESSQTIRSVLPLVRLPNPNPTGSKGVVEVTKLREYFSNLSSNLRKEEKFECQSPVLRSLSEKGSMILTESPGKRKVKFQKNEEKKRKRVGQDD